MSTESSKEISPTGSELEKDRLEMELQAPEGRSEVGTEDEEDERDLRSIRGAGSNQQSLFPQTQLQQTRSRSSARSARSYTDGYSHFEHDEEEKRDEAANESGDESREFEVHFEGDADPLNPKNKSAFRKWCIVLIGCVCSLCVTCASALYTSTYEQMEAEYHVSREVATIGLTTYVCGLGLGPMFLSPLSEFYG